MNIPSLSIIIPCVNEEEQLTELLPQLQVQREISLELIVVDGGSTDKSSAVAEAAGARVLHSERGRAVQMNYGARHASAEYLLFLHADSRFNDPSALRRSLEALTAYAAERSPAPVAGHFSLIFRSTHGATRRAYRYYEAKTHLNRRETFNGDQGMMLRAADFFALGGFDESLPFLEDQRFSRRLQATGSWLTLPAVLSTSARRFESEGLARRMILSAIIMGLHDIEFRQFFEQVPALYREHSRGGRLELAPFLSRIHRLAFADGLRVGLTRWLKVGRYVRQNAWQLFFLADVTFGRRLFARDLFLQFHDRIFAPLTRFLLFDLITAGLTLTWFYLSWGYFALETPQGTSSAPDPLAEI